MESHLKEKDLIPDEEINAARTEVDSKIQEAVDFAESSPFPAPEALYEDVYA
jgi:pyruvate dehydrogenase E1 component alpha subunit